MTWQPDRSIGVGIIGAGQFGAAHARAIAEAKGLAVTAACRRNMEAAAAFTKTHGGTPYADWRLLLEAKDVDVVLVATPHHLHGEMAVAAAHAGKDILIEKPMASTVAACDAIIEAVEATGVRCMVGHIMQFLRPSRVARQILESGELGRPLVGWSTLSKVWMDETRQAWHLFEESGGGMMMSAGIHALDQLVWLMNRPVTGVIAMMGTLFHQQEADDAALLGLRFAEGGFAQIQSVGYSQGASKRATEIFCEKGALRIAPYEATWIGRNGAWQEVPDSRESNGARAALVREWEAMAEAIRTGTPPPVSAAYGRTIVSIIAAGKVASAERREVVPE